MADQLIPTAETRLPSVRSTGAWKRVAPAIALAAWGGNHFTPLLMLYRNAEGFTALEVDLFLAFYVLGLIPGFLLAGPLSDRFGRKPLMFVGLGLGIAASILLAANPGSITVISVGRFVAGLSVAIAMVVGTSWIKELSAPPWDAGAGPGTGARRSSITLTLGLGIGAVVSGALAQWGPAPTVLPYLIQIALSLIAAIILTRAPRTRPLHQVTGSFFGDLRIPRASRRRFFGVVLPVAPWVFSAAALAYAVTPALLENKVGHDTVGFATLLTALTLGAATLIQPFTHTIAARTHHHNALIGLELVIAGTALCAINATVLSVPLALLDAIVFGCAYGICMVSGLVEVQKMAPPNRLAGLTGIYYSLTYVGFLLPVALSALNPRFSSTTLLSALVVICIVCTVIVGRSLKRTETDG